MNNGLSDHERAYYKALGTRIAQRRKEVGLTQVQMAEILSIPQQTYSSYEVGRHGVPLAMLPKLSEVLKIETDALLGISSKTHSKRGPAPMLQRHIERIGELPKSKQRLVLEMLEGVFAQSR